MRTAAARMPDDLSTRLRVRRPHVQQRLRAPARQGAEGTRRSLHTGEVRERVRLLPDADLPGALPARLPELRQLLDVRGRRVRPALWAGPGAAHMRAARLRRPRR